MQSFDSDKTPVVSETFSREQLRSNNYDPPSPTYIKKIIVSTSPPIVQQVMVCRSVSPLAEQVLLTPHEAIAQ